MTDNTLYDSLADDVKEGAKKNRIRAMQLVAVCRYREQKKIGEMEYRLIAPKTWALKKIKASPVEEAPPNRTTSQSTPAAALATKPDSRTLPGWGGCSLLP